MRTELWLALLAAGLVPAVASALNLQFKPSAHVEVQHDDNVFRAADEALPDSAPRTADTLTETGVAATLTLRESLQELELRGEYDRIRYSTLDTLDYDRYLVGGQARLAMASTLKLRLDATRERRQENFAFRNDTEQSFITVDQGKAELSYAVTPRWTGLARVEQYETSFSRAASQDSDLSETAGELAVEYRRNGFSTVGLGYRQSEGDYPRRIVVAGDGREKEYTQQSLFSRIGYTPSGLSELTAQLGYTQRTHDDALVRDFNGVTGRASYLRKFSGISQLQIEAYRDLYYVEDINANYVENLGVRLSYDYEWSAKLRFAASIEQYDSSYEGSPGVNSSGEPREDEVLGFRIGADYQPFYRFSILPEYRYEQRDSNFANSRYDFQVIGVDLSYTYGVRAGR